MLLASSKDHHHGRYRSFDVAVDAVVVATNVALQSNHLTKVAYFAFFHQTREIFVAHLGILVVVCS